MNKSLYPKAINIENLTVWFLKHIDAVTPPLTFELIKAGRSNLTYKVTDHTQKTWALRRPPLAQVLASAHDMGREYKIISALGSVSADQHSIVPVAHALAYCDDLKIIGCPFFVMEWVDGYVIRDSRTADKVLSNNAKLQISRALTDVLANLHMLEPSAIGLDNLGPKENYIKRQLKRWYQQFQSHPSTPELYKLITKGHNLLTNNIPEQQRASIVHGDYRLDNVVVSDAGQLKAVLDWELCTLGDPLADLGMLMVYWAEPADPNPLLGAPTAATGFLTRKGVRSRYASSSKLNLSNLSFYIAFGKWKIACILHGVNARYLKGGQAGDPSDTKELSEQVYSLANSVTKLMLFTI
ncbi:MAG: phosphotransferase family protein [Actinobacteria bacterium]|nr:phosphotransferase family protein [Actinomycetota bacterium]